MAEPSRQRLRPIVFVMNPFDYAVSRASRRFARRSSPRHPMADGVAVLVRPGSNGRMSPSAAARIVPELRRTKLQEAERRSSAPFSTPRELAWLLKHSGAWACHRQSSFRARVPRCACEASAPSSTARSPVPSSDCASAGLAAAPVFVMERARHPADVIHSTVLP